MSRPTRMSSPSRRSISIRVTQPEFDLLTKAAHPMPLSRWLRTIAFESVEVKMLMPTTEDQSDQIAQVRTAYEHAEVKLREMRESAAGNPEKQKFLDAVEPLLDQMFALARIVLEKRS